MDISNKTTEELKSLAYDQLMLREQVMQNLNLLQAELMKRAQQEVTEPVEGSHPLLDALDDKPDPED